MPLLPDPEDGPEEIAVALSLPRNRAGTLALGTRIGAAMDLVGAGGRARYRAELVAEEILTNLVKYGGEGSDPVEFRIVQGPTELRLEVFDRTRAYSPESSEPEELGQDRRRVQEGGLGLALVRQSTDALYYDTDEDGRNRTIAVFRRDSAKEDLGTGEPPPEIDGPRD